MTARQKMLVEAAKATGQMTVVFDCTGYEQDKEVVDFLYSHGKSWRPPRVLQYIKVRLLAHRRDFRKLAENYWTTGSGRYGLDSALRDYPVIKVSDVFMYEQVFNTLERLRG